MSVTSRNCSSLCAEFNGFAGCPGESCPHKPSVDAKQSEIQGAIIVLGAMLRGLHVAERAGYVAKLMAEAGVTADLTLLGEAGDTERFARTVIGALAQHDETSWHLGSGCYGRVLEADS